MNKVLIADSVSSAVSEVFDKNGIAYDTKIGLSEDELTTCLLYTSPSPRDS